MEFRRAKSWLSAGGGRLRLLRQKRFYVKDSVRREKLDPEIVKIHFVPLVRNKNEKKLLGLHCAYLTELGGFLPAIAKSVWTIFDRLCDRTVADEEHRFNYPVSGWLLVCDGRQEMSGQAKDNSVRAASGWR